MEMLAVLLPFAATAAAFLPGLRPLLNASAAAGKRAGRNSAHPLLTTISVATPRRALAWTAFEPSRRKKPLRLTAWNRLAGDVSP